MRKRVPKKGPDAPSERKDAHIPKNEADLTEELRSIYGSDEARIEDMTRLEKANKPLIRKILVGMIVFFAFLAAVSWAGFFLFSPTDDKFSGEGVKLTIEGPKEIRSGEPVSYKIFYENGERVALGTASLEIRLPDEFIVQKTSPTADRNSWHIGSIGPHKKGEVSIDGVYLAPLGKELDLQAILTYRPADFNSEFQKVATETVKIIDSVIDAEITGPPKVLPGDTVTLSLEYTNRSENAFEGVVFRMMYPEGFIPESSDPAATDDSFTEWLIPSVKSEEEASIRITGSFASDAKGKIDITAQAGFMDIDEEFQLQKEAVFTTDVLEGDLVTTLILNGKSEAQTANFGDMMRYTVSYRNTGSVSLEDVAISVVFETEPEDARMLIWNDLEDPKNAIRNGNRLTWDADQLEELERIGPEDEGTINFELPLLEGPLTDITEVDYQVTTWVETLIGTIDGEKADRMTQTQPIITRINSDTMLESEARYFDDDSIPLGSGPLPPQAERQTTYRVFWHIANSFHELSDLKISAKLPSGSSWTGTSSIDAGDLQFDAGEEKMIWILNWLPTSIHDLTVSFDIAFTPSLEQAGNIPTIMEATIMEAIDKMTGASILLSSPPLTTALENDGYAGGKARVQR